MKCFDVRPAKREDRLLRISHDKQFARLQFNIPPCRRRSIRPFGEKQEDLVLDRIGILKLIHQNRLETDLHERPDLRMVFQQVPRSREESCKPPPSGFKTCPPPALS